MEVRTVLSPGEEWMLMSAETGRLEIMASIVWRMFFNSALVVVFDAVIVEAVEVVE